MLEQKVSPPGQRNRIRKQAIVADYVVNAPSYPHIAQDLSSSSPTQTDNCQQRRDVVYFHASAHSF